MLLERLFQLLLDPKSPCIIRIGDLDDDSDLVDSYDAYANFTGVLLNRLINLINFNF